MAKYKKNWMRKILSEGQSGKTWYWLKASISWYSESLEAFSFPSTINSISNPIAHLHIKAMNPTFLITSDFNYPRKSCNVQGSSSDVWKALFLTVELINLLSSGACIVWSDSCVWSISRCKTVLRIAFNGECREAQKLESLSRPSLVISRTSNFRFYLILYSYMYVETPVSCQTSRGCTSGAKKKILWIQ